MTTTTGIWTQGPRWSSWPAWPGTGGCWSWPSRHDKMQQRVDTQMITLDGQGMHLRPLAIRYSWPAELDLMAGRAGLRLAERHADWDRRPFTSASTSHVSVYQRA